jgi:hypothetical protein
MAIAGLIALLLVAYFLARVRLNPALPSDFDQVWAASRALVLRKNPYTAVGPHGTVLTWGYPLFYPLTAAVMALPLALLPLVWARAVFAGVSAGLLAYVITRDGYHRLVLFASASFYVAGTFAQWESLLLASALIPGAGLALLAKPNVGMALAAGFSRSGPRWIGLSVAGAVLLVLTSIVADPHWIVDWLAAIRSGTLLRAPLLAPAGFFVLLGLTRWRRAEARVLVAMACLPQTGLLYASLPLFVVPSTFAEYLALGLCSWVAYAVQAMDAPTTATLMHRVTIASVLCMYLPATAMVLRRPNVWTALQPT